MSPMYVYLCVLIMLFPVPAPQRRLHCQLNLLFFSGCTLLFATKQKIFLFKKKDTMLDKTPSMIENSILISRCYRTTVGDMSRTCQYGPSLEHHYYFIHFFVSFKDPVKNKTVTAIPC